MQSLSRTRWLVAVVALLSLIGASLLAAPSMAAASDARVAPQPAKISAELTQKFALSSTQDFWVKLNVRYERTDRSTDHNWALRGTQVAEGLRDVADSTQAPLRALLDERGIDYDTYWVSNAIHVKGATLSLANELSSFTVVDSIFAPFNYEIEKPEPGSDTPARDASIEWGIDNINADDVWDQYGVRGEGITIANVDTGVDYTHPALVEHYRGNLGDGTFDHNYNWYDPGHQFMEPTDFLQHGTHTMGTMVGDDGGDNQIGVAPGANWIASMGVDTGPIEQILDAMQWMLEPTDLNGENPDASKRPHIVSNSWGIPFNQDPFGEDIQQGWNDSGIFGVFAAGNEGPSCDTHRTPGFRSINYAVGAYDINNNIADFSSRGPGQDDEVKPNISAPGVDVRSSIPGGQYASFSGTSMATPHTAGAIALLWSAAPAMIGDIEGTRALLDETAIDTEDLQCGGTPDDNSVYGEGRLDALALVQAAPMGDTGTLEGTVTNADGDPIQGATVHVVGPLERDTTTDADGYYSVRLSTGTYDVTVSAFGYEDQTQTAEVTTDETTTLDFTLEAAESYPVTGTVTDESTGEPVEGAEVTIVGSPFTTTTGSDGTFSFDAVPTGTYQITVDAGGCLATASQELVVDGPEEVNISLAAVRDGFGYGCTEEPSAYVEGDTALAITGDDAAASVELPFPFTFYGVTYSTANVASNGYLNFLQPDAFYANEQIPSANPPNAYVAPYWDDLFVETDSGVYTGTGGEEGSRYFTVEWRNVSFTDDPERSMRVDVEATLWENGDIVTSYRNIDSASDREAGLSATIGIENESGTDGLEYSYNEPAVSDDTSIHFALPPNGYVTGTVTDGNDGDPIAGATVTIVDEGGNVVRTLTTDEDGTYRTQLLLGTYTVQASKGNYTSASASFTIDDPGETVVVDLVLETAVADVDPNSLEFILEPGQQRSADLTITNSGTQDLSWEILEIDRGSGRVAGERQLNNALVPTWRDGRLYVPDRSARTAEALYGSSREGAARVAGPQEAGDVLAEWPATGLSLPWGVGDAGNLWISDPNLVINKEYQPDGTPTGVEFPADWAEVWNADMAYDPNAGAMCQVEVANVGGDIVCWDPSSGNPVYTVSGPSEPWGAISQRGLGYNAIDDVFYIGGWNEGIIYTVAGASHTTPGETLNQCSPEGPSISGLGYNSTSGTLWVATNSPDDTIFQVNPTDCATISTIADPGSAEFSGAGLELDAQGNIWATDQAAGVVRLIESGVPAVSDVPWLTVEPTSGEAAPGESDTVTVTVDTTGLEAGTTYEATLIVRTNAGRIPNVSVPVKLVVPSFLAAVNVGGEEYTEADGDEWWADQAYTTGGWGWTGQRAEVEWTHKAIGGTDDDPLFQDRRTGIFQYRFDSVPAGTYQVELGFAEYKVAVPGQRLFDVLVNGQYALIAHDTMAEVADLYADVHTVTVEHSGGQLVVSLVNRPLYELPILNSLKVVERPDL